MPDQTAGDLSLGGGKRSETADSAHLADSYPPIGSLGVVGDGHSLALLGPDGAVEWYCPLRFDAPPALWPLLDRKRGGALRIGPAASLETRVRYVREIPVLEYEWQTPRGRVTARVWMAWPKPADRQELLWLVTGVSGESDVEVRFRPSPAFGRAAFELAPHPSGCQMVAGHLQLFFSSSRPLQVTTAGIDDRLLVRAGETLAFRLRATAGRGVDRAGSIGVHQALRSLDETASAWRRWVAEAVRWDGPHRDAIVRSATVLKLLIYEPSGAVVAAGTTSLPEVIGGVRNWDYRYTWLRDASFTLNALYQLGCREEARRYGSWMHRTTAAHGLPLRVLYGIDGETEFPEIEIGEAHGYRGSRPVRVGNAAEHQLQLDVYGELLDCTSICEIMGDPVIRDDWPHFRSLVDFVADNWREPDSGIWEVRDRPRHFVYSKVMAWVALDRGIRLARYFQLEADLERWLLEREALRRQILERGVVARFGRFSRSYGEDVLDATLLLLPAVGFIPAEDPRMTSTIDAVLKELTPSGAAEGLLLRYPHEAGDGLPGKEGAFTICSFWLVEALALAGRRQQAEDIFEGILKLGGDLGVFAEQIDWQTGEQLGNFPQAFTHIGLINAALRLVRRTVKGKPLQDPAMEAASAW